MCVRVVRQGLVKTDRWIDPIGPRTAIRAPPPNTRAKYAHTHTTNRVLSTLDAEDDEGRTALTEAREQGRPGALLALAQVRDWWGVGGVGLII